MKSPSVFFDTNLDFPVEGRVTQLHLLYQSASQDAADSKL